MHLQTAFFVLPLAFAVTSASAQTPAATVEVRFGSIKELLPKTEYLADILGQGESARQFRRLIETLSTETEGVEGIDPERPIGAYAIIQPDLAESPGIIILPLRSEERFLKMLKDRLEYSGQDKNGIHTFAIPGISEKLYFRIKEKYAYLSYLSSALELSQLPSPGTFFTKPDGSIASVVVHFDRIPHELKTLVIGQVELRLHEAQAQGNSKVEQTIHDLVTDAAAAAVKSLIADTQKFQFRLFVDPKSDMIRIESQLQARFEGGLSRTISDLGHAISRPRAMVFTNPASFRVALAAGIPASYRERFHQLLDRVVEEGLKEIPQESRPLVQRLVDAILPTLKMETYEASAAMVARSKPHQTLTTLAAIRMKDTQPLLELLKFLALVIPQPVAEFAFDQEKRHGFVVHHIRLDPQGKKPLRLWLAASGEYLIITTGESPEPLAQALAAQAAPSPAFELVADPTRLADVVLSDPSKSHFRELVRKIYGDTTPGPDQIQLTVTGGDTLTMTFQSQGKTLKLLRLFAASPEDQMR